MLKMILLGISISAENKVLYGNELLDRFSSYCSPTYKFIESEGTLTNLVAIFRHGDRAPIEINNHWKDQKCMKCTNNECFATKCASGMLTVKGFEQGKELGKFIKKNYIPKFDGDITVKGHVTSINRTKAMINGVYEGIDITNIKTEELNEMIGPSKCSSIQRFMYFDKLISTSDDIKEYKMLDNIVTGICNPVKVLCDNLDCDITRMEDFLDQTHLKHEDKMTKIRENIALNGVSFALLSNLISKKMEEKNTISLLSTHDSTLSTLLNGLNIPINDLPSYGSTLFIELWKDHNGNRYIRINYNGEIQRFGFFKETHVAYKEFMKYLNLFGSKKQKISKICNSYSDDGNTIEMNAASDKIRLLFNPIAKMLHDRQIEPVVEADKKLIPTLLNFLNLQNDLSENLIDKSSYLFGWLFGSDSSKTSQAKSDNVANKEKPGQKHESSESKNNKTTKPKKKLKKLDCKDLESLEESGSEECLDDCSEIVEPECPCTNERQKCKALKRENECSEPTPCDCATKVDKQISQTSCKHKKQPRSAFRSPKKTLIYKEKNVCNAPEFVEPPCNSKIPVSKPSNTCDFPKLDLDSPCALKALKPATPKPCTSKIVTFNPPKPCTKPVVFPTSNSSCSQPIQVGVIRPFSEGNQLSSGQSIGQNISIGNQEEFDPEIHELIKKEEGRQRNGLELIASENFASISVLQAGSSILCNKYSEGQVGHRYYGGNEFIDSIEGICKSRALSLFNLNPEIWDVNVQTLSGSGANLAAYLGAIGKGGRIMGLDLPSGGHLTHGYKTSTRKISASSIFFESMSYKCKNGKIDYDQLEIDAAEFKPSLLVCGASAYPHDFDYKRLRKIAGDAYLMMDMAHISGFIATGIMENAFEHCDIVTTTTHKLLRGPRSAMIFYKKLKNQIVDGKEITIDLKAKIDFAVFPGLQGGPHNQKIGALAVALKQANTQEYKDYCKQVHSNALTLCEEFKKMGYELYSNGTSSHLLLLCLKDVSGIEVERVCELANISINKNCIPTDKSPWNPSAIRIGTPPLTTRGFKESDFVKVAALIDEAIKIATDLSPKTHDNSNKLDLAKLVEAALKDGRILDLKVRVEKFSSHFPIPVFDYRLKK